MTLKIRNFSFFNFEFYINCIRIEVLHDVKNSQFFIRKRAQVPGRKLQQSHPERLHVLPDRLFQPLKGQLNLHNTIYLFKYVL